MSNVATVVAQAERQKLHAACLLVADYPGTHTTSTLGWDWTVLFVGRGQLKWALGLEQEGEVLDQASGPVVVQQVEPVSEAPNSTSQEPSSSPERSLPSQYPAMLEEPGAELQAPPPVSLKFRGAREAGSTEGGTHGQTDYETPASAGSDLAKLQALRTGISDKLPVPVCRQGPEVLAVPFHAMHEKVSCHADLHFRASDRG